MLSRLARMLACLLALAAVRQPAFALQFEPVVINANTVVVGGRGPIVPGDAARLERALAAVPAGDKLLGLAFDSPGGSVGEAVLMADTIRRLNLTVIIPSDSKCASACFLLLAAAPRRLAAEDALIGVHSASESGEETEASMAVTTAMARAAAGFGVPAVIIGKMVETQPGRVEWLTPQDLALMGVGLFRTTGSAEQAPPPVMPSVAAPPSPPPLILPAPVPFTPAIAAFKGAFFCGDRPASLSLRLMGQADGANRRAILGIGPTSSNPGVVSSNEVVEGQFDMQTGTLDLHPAAASAPPGGYGAVGLVGRSADGGRTFAGHVVGGPGCTMFTLSRVQ